MRRVRIVEMGRRCRDWLTLLGWVDFAGMGGLCWDGWTLLRWVDFAEMGDFVVLWGCVLEALGLIFEDFFVPGGAKLPSTATGGQNEGPGWPKVPFLGENVVNFGSHLVPYLLKVGAFRGMFEGLTLGWYLVLLWVAHGSQNRCFWGGRPLRYAV